METTTQIKEKKGRRFFMAFLSAIGAVTILGFVVSIIGILSFTYTKDVSDNTVLELNLERNFLENTPDDPFAGSVLQGAVPVRDVVDALDKAASDDRIVALIARAGTGVTGLARMQEIRDAVLSFRESGKPAIAFSETFGGPGNGAYYLATAFSQIYLLPTGDIGLTGLITESPFIKGTLDKLGIVPRGDRRYEYKNAFNIFTETAYTDHHREAAQSLLNSRFDQLVRGIADQRDLTESAVRDIIDSGPLLGKEAEDTQLVDGLKYRDEVFDLIEEEFGEDVTYLSIADYLERAGRPNDEGTGVALIYGVGSIKPGASGFDALFMESSMGSETISRAFRSAVEDEEIKAILFRIDSPGGYYVPSDVIRRAIIRARDADKPVIVSMGNVAASGGYFVAMPSDKIVAQPGTVTGSIGVFSLKLLTRDFWGKLGITWDEVHAGKNATAWSSLHDYTPEQWERYGEWLDQIYEDFTTKVAEDRSLPQERVLEIAKGRVWTGEDAYELGLVDELGGFPTALRLIRESLGLPENAPLDIEIFPEPKTFLESVISRFTVRIFGEEPAGLTVRTIQTIQPVLRFMRQAGAGGEQGVLTTPYYDIYR
jgi:protease-4